MSGEAHDPRPLAGPLDDVRWPDKLKARVVLPGPRPTIHGYDVETDLARHYSFAETMLLALTGELPAPERARAFEVALHFLSPSSVDHAPVHAAVLARICDVTTSAIVGTAALGLAEQARAVVHGHAAWLRLLEARGPRAGDEWAPNDDEERASVQRLREALGSAARSIAVLVEDIGRMPALIATLHFAGLTRADQIESALVMARLPTALAEALATPSHSYRDYPVDLPAVVYADPT